MKLSVGDKAPEFTLYDSDKNEVSLSDFRGNHLVILFFPFAFTGLCTKELCGIRDNMNIYSSLNAKVVAISVDSIFTLQRFKEDQGFNFSLLSDFNTEVSRAYGALYESFALGMKGVSKRSAFVVDPNGTITYAEVSDDAGQLPNFVKIQT